MVWRKRSGLTQVKAGSTDVLTAATKVECDKMTGSRPPLHQPVNPGGDTRQMWAGTSDPPDGRKIRGALRLKDILNLDISSREVLNQLRALHQAARVVIGNNLANDTLDYQTLVRLSASLRRQVADAAALRKRLEPANAASGLASEVEGLADFLRSALREVERRIGSAH